MSGFGHEAGYSKYATNPCQYFSVCRVSDHAAIILSELSSLEHELVQYLVCLYFRVHSSLHYYARLCSLSGVQLKVEAAIIIYHYALPYVNME